MKSLINIERIKTLYSPSFRTIIILHASLFFLVALIAGSIKLNIQGVSIEKIMQFPHIWNTLAWIASWFNLLLGILAIMLVSNEFQFRTFRKQIIDGLSRNELVFGKIIVFAAIAIYTMLLVFATGLIMGTIKSSGFNLSNFTQGLAYLPVLFLQSFSYMLLAMLFAFLFKNTALSIVSFILYFFPIEPIIRSIIPDVAIKFLPVKVIANLTPMPDFVGISMGDMIHINQGSSSTLQNMGLVSESMPLIYAALVAVGYCLLFAFTSKLIVQRNNF